MSQLLNSGVGVSSIDIETINLDQGSITGNSVTLYAHQNPVENAGATVQFIAINSTTGQLNFTDASGNTMLGQAAGNLSGTYSLCTALGFQALNIVTTGVQNTAVGYNSQQSMTTGSTNTSVGISSLASNISGTKNVAIGQNCMSNNTGSNNTCVGAQSMQNGGAGTDNSCVGYLSGSNISSGSRNVCVGAQALLNLTTGSYNTILGEETALSYTGNETGNIIIGAGVTGTVGESQTIRIGNTQTATYITGINGSTVTGSAVLCATNGLLGTVVSSERYKENIEEIKDDVSILNLKTVTFNYKVDQEKRLQYGMIAEDVHDKFPYLCLYNEENQPETLKYHEICVFLLHEIKKMDKRINELENK